MYSANGTHSEVHELAAQLYRDSYRHLLGIANRNAANEVDAEEALNDAFASFLRVFDPNGEAPALPWITLVLKRECWHKRRAAHLDLQLGQEVEGGGEELGSVIESIPSGAPDLGQRIVERDDARRRLARLKPDERTAVGYFAVGLSYREIGERRGWSYAKVNRCISEGRAALRAQPAH